MVGVLWFFQSFDSLTVHMLVDELISMSRSSGILVAMPSVFDWSIGSFWLTVDGRGWETKQFGSCEEVYCQLTCFFLQAGYSQFSSWWLLWGPVLHFWWKTLALELHLTGIAIVFDCRIIKHFPQHSLASFTSANFIHMARRMSIEGGTACIYCWLMGFCPVSTSRYVVDNSIFELLGQDLWLSPER